jgi:hypothetical protein
MMTFQRSPRTWSRICFKSSAIFFMLYAFASSGLSCPHVSAQRRPPKRHSYGIAITQAIGRNYAVPSSIPCLDLAAEHNCELRKAVECDDRASGCPSWRPVWRLVDQAVGVPRSIVSGDCCSAAVESIDGHEDGNQPGSGEWEKGVCLLRMSVFSPPRHLSRIIHTIGFAWWLRVGSVHTLLNNRQQEAD